MASSTQKDIHKQLYAGIDRLLEGSEEWRKFLKRFAQHVTILLQVGREVINLCEGDGKGKIGMIEEAKNLDRKMTTDWAVTGGVQTGGAVLTTGAGVVAIVNWWNPGLHLCVPTTLSGRCPVSFGLSCCFVGIKQQKTPT